MEPCNILALTGITSYSYIIPSKSKYLHVASIHKEVMSHFVLQVSLLLLLLELVDEVLIHLGKPHFLQGQGVLIFGQLHGDQVIESTGAHMMCVCFSKVYNLEADPLFDSKSGTVK